MSTPEVSVVMAVYNGASHLEETLVSVLSQEDCDFELVVVDDGATDDTGRILDEWARRDKRLRVFHQQNTGLTLALIKGCAASRSELIARQDAGDVSLPDRLRKQRDFLQAHPDTVMTACAVQFAAPLGERLYEIAKPMERLDAGLRRLDIRRLSGPPHHGATLFRRAAYIKAGGYRAPFTVAQDIDLWLRLAELGQCLGMKEVLYRARMEAGSISSRRRAEQLRLGNLAVACAQRRQSSLDERALLDAHVSPTISKHPVTGGEKARFHYFIASCLRDKDPMAARRYYQRALRDNPLHLKALLRWFIG